MLGGALFLAAGVYQWTPLKHACLKHCRSPMAFIMGHWRPGAWGAFRMGVGHGAFCLGCCAFVMGLLFVGGVMNLAWVAAITVFVVAEKLAPRGEWVARDRRHRHGRSRHLPARRALRAVLSAGSRARRWRRAGPACA